MSKKKKNIGKTGIPGSRPNVTVAYIAIPVDVDRQTYIKESLRLGKVCVLTEYGEFIKNVKIGKITSQFIDFPSSYDELGSMVICVTEPFHKQLIIIDVYNKLDELNTLEENQFNLQKESEDASVNIYGDANSGQINIDVDSEVAKGGKLNISVLNGDDNAEVNLFTKGEINLESVGKVNIKATEEFNADISHPDFSDKTTINANKSQVDIKSPTINHNNGEEPMVKGDTLKKDILDQLIDLLLQATTPTAIGTQPLANILPQLQKLKQQTKTILSKKSNLE